MKKCKTSRPTAWQAAKYREMSAAILLNQLWEGATEEEPSREDVHVQEVSQDLATRGRV